MQIPLLGEMTPMRLFFLFLFFYTSDSNSLGTWCTFGAGMLLSNLCDLIKQPNRNNFQLVLSALVTAAVLGYAHVYQQQGRMMSFLALQSLIVPLFKFKYCLQMVDGKPVLDGKPLILALPTLLIFLYVFDGMSGLTSGVLFLIVLPECTARLPSITNFRTILFYLLVIGLAAPFTLLVVGAVYYEKELLQAPPEYLSMAKRVQLPYSHCSACAATYSTASRPCCIPHPSLRSKKRHSCGHIPAYPAAAHLNTPHPP
jgi:hypothetical protein